VVPLVCTGRVTPFGAQIKAAIQKFNLFDQIQFMGYRSETEVKILYRLCTAVVVPTQFESVSFPIWEAFDAGRPVACSTATSLPAQVGDAGLLFDPEDPGAIADAIRSLWETPELRERLGRLGTERLRQFSLDRFALHMRALYRHIAGTTDARDREILAAASLI
jgi:glycosyltransferase involved in cell wall biosynthesis